MNMNASELLAVAKRLSIRAARTGDSDIVVQYILATVHADDDEPVTVERLTKLLGEPGYIRKSGCNWIVEDPYCEVGFYTKTSVVMFYSQSIQLDAEPKTMGQLRTLLRLAGIKVPR